MRRYRILRICAATLSLGACSTQELATPPPTITDIMPAADRGALLIVFASTAETFERQQALAVANQYGPPYHLFMDGRQVAYRNGDALEPYTLLEGSEGWMGFLPAGTHDFTIAVAGGGPTVFTASGEIPAGSMTRLYLFGSLAALQGRFVSYPAAPPAGMVHVSLMNLVRTGQRIEVVACAQDDACAALSPPLALGESFDADFAGGPMPEGSLDYGLSTGERIGMRQVPDARLAAPPVQLMFPGIDLDPVRSEPPANLVTAPNYISPEGNVRAFFN